MQPPAWSRDLAASWKVFGRLRLSESWGPVASQERALPPVPRAAASKPVPRAGPQSLRTREEESFRRSEERWSTSKVKNRTKDLAEGEPGLAEETE